MIEFCTKRRMVGTILLLTSVSVMMLFFENRWSSQHKLKKAKLAAKALTNASCNPGTVTVIEPCKICPRDENRKELSFCKQTGYKEFVQCSNGKQIFRGCDIVPAVEQKTFYIFESICTVIAVISYTVVRHRRKHLDRLVADKINKQIASG
ncbi:hypothetical protein LOTGIDRAFT_149774, partial [Lottia gigantea]